MAAPEERTVHVTRRAFLRGAAVMTTATAGVNVPERAWDAVLNSFARKETLK